MKQRTITSAIILVAIIPLIIYSEYIVYPIALSILSAVAVYEILGIVGSARNVMISLPAYGCALAMPLLVYLTSSDKVKNFLLIFFVFAFVYLVYLMAVAVFSKGKISFSRICESFCAVIYVSVSFAALSLIRYLDRNVGIYQLALVFIVSWVCDACAYIVGSLIGRRKLIPEVSPKKTVEGALGGIVFATAAYLVFGILVDKFTPNIEVSYGLLAIYGVLLSVVSQIGDLVASLIKREHGAKDYGNILPGHGGIMDRFDSILAVSTILLILCIIFPPFVSV